MKIHHMVPDKDGTFVLDYIADKITRGGVEAISMYFPNGATILLKDTVYGDIEVVISYDGGKNWFEGGTFNPTRFLEYINSIKLMTKEEVDKR